MYRRLPQPLTTLGCPLFAAAGATKAAGKPDVYAHDEEGLQAWV
ncbi:hypothetical protein [Streptomyces sp. NBC_01185]|nr:hypothetical protein OG770_00690 [Streptomyces sp. NBC_01185]